MGAAKLRCVTFSFWDTLYESGQYARREGFGRTAATALTGAHASADDALLMLPPAMIPGAWQALKSLSQCLLLAVVGDTRLASARAQDRLLEKDAARQFFASTCYAGGLAAVARQLAIEPPQILHVGDDEWSDVRPAISAGFRASRLDLARNGGASQAEFVARSFDELATYLSAQ